jgi:hypothetical protein
MTDQLCTSNGQDEHDEIHDYFHEYLSLLPGFPQDPDSPTDREEHDGRGAKEYGSGAARYKGPYIWFCACSVQAQ